MKKLIILLLALASFTAYSQEILVAKISSRGTLNPEVNQEQPWIWSPDRQVEITFTVHDDIILVNDRAKSAYRLMKVHKFKPSKYYEQYGWDAIDEKDRNCLFKFVKYPGGELAIYVIYAEYGVCYRYEAVSGQDDTDGL